jgi:DNA-binding NtrC family response regulator
METLSVLVVSPCEEDSAAVRGALTGSVWKIRSARTCEQAWRILHESPVHVVLAEADLPNGFDWRDLLNEVESMHGGPPVIIMSRVADDGLWVDVLSLGGYDLLAKPLDSTELFQVLTLAARQSAAGYLPGTPEPLAKAVAAA